MYGDPDGGWKMLDGDDPKSSAGFCLSMDAGGSEFRFVQCEFHIMPIYPLRRVQAALQL